MTIDDFIKRMGQGVLYHFTDVSNLPLIKEHGLLSIRELRKRGIHPPKPGSNSISRKKDTELGLDRFVRLCPKNMHPMEYRAKEEKRIGPTVFLEISCDVLRLPDICGCSQVAYKNGAVVRPLEEALDEFDLEVLYDIPFPEVLAYEDTKNRFNKAKKSEILVPDHIPASLILNLHD